MNKYLVVCILLIVVLIFYRKQNENFAPYASILIPKIYLSDTAHDNRKSCDVARFDVSGVYNGTMLDFNTCDGRNLGEL